MHRLLYMVIFCMFASYSNGQTCTNPGQNPATAFPVCGSTTFTQNSVPLCGNRSIINTCGDVLTDKNPYWYKFTCYKTGTLGFVISPLAANEDYDWQIFDVTGVTNLDQVYTNISLFVTSSWSGSFGNTGASSAGTVAYACGGSTPLFTRMPTLIAGNEYLLLVSHYTNGQSGYNLTFGGGTASITDTVQAHLTSAVAACDGIHINVKLNKKMRCTSLATNGSDFTINSSSASFVAATGFGCANGFDLDSLQLTLNNPLAPGTYKIKLQAGSDQNTLLDLCGTAITNDSVELVVPPQVAVPMDSLQVVECNPQSLNLVFKGALRCNTVAADGSDFIITGPSAVIVSQAVATCSGSGLTQLIKVNFAAPIKIGGTYTIRLQNGSDANTLLNDCNQATAAGSSLPFVVRDSVSTVFTSNIVYNTCSTSDSVRFSHAGLNGANQWNWVFDSGTPATSTLQNTWVAYNTPGTYQVTLKVSNGFCSDSITRPITINALTKDLVLPKLASAVAPCQGTQIFVKLNKKIKCGSIALNGSDFTIRPAASVISSAIGLGCGASAETDSVLINFATPLPTGNYTLVVVNGNDGNTFTDNCSRTIPINDSIPGIAVVFHNVVTMDSISKVGCRPQELVLLFKEPVLCSSIAADGSDFAITGTGAATITQATGNCNANGFTNTIKLTLSSAITRAGSFRVVLKNGADGNTLLNECNAASIVGGSLPFVTGDTVSPAFTQNIGYACSGRDTVSFFHPALNGENTWKWNFGISTSTLQNPVVYYTSYGPASVSLTVSNGICTDSATQTFIIQSDTLHASFETPSFICPNDLMTIKNNSRGNITNYDWDFGDGTTSTFMNPIGFTYSIPLRETVYDVKLTITGSMGCKADTTVKVRVLNNCVIAVPTAFTPNGDGMNDYLYPTNAFKADKLMFRVFNRFGQLVFESRTRTQKWDGRINGEYQPAGAYVWFLNYVDTETKKTVALKGTTVLIR